MTLGWFGAALALTLQGNAMKATRVEANVVYGMHCGAALLLDVHHPSRPKGLGVVYIPGSAWHAPSDYGALPLKALDTGVPFVDQFNRGFVDPLLEAGYTVFVVCHRAAPAYRHPAAVEDVRRAVRYVRAHAERFGIRGDAIGAVGYSSGAHLASLLGLMPGDGTPASADPVERQSSRVQCVVGGATPSDLADVSAPYLTPAIASYLGALLFFSPPGSPEQRAAAHASPLTHAAPGGAAHLLFHGDQDEVIPFAHSERLADKLREAGVAVKLVTIPGGTHMNTRPAGGPDYVAEMLAWLDAHLPKR